MYKAFDFYNVLDIICLMQKFSVLYVKEILEVSLFVRSVKFTLSNVLYKF